MTGPLIFPSAPVATMQATAQQTADRKTAAGSETPYTVQHNTAEGNGDTQGKTVNGISYLRAYGTTGAARSSAWSAMCAAVSSTLGCNLMDSPSDFDGSQSRMFMTRPNSGGTGGTSYFVVQANGKPFSQISHYQGVLGFRSSNSVDAQGSAVVVNVDRTHRVAQSTLDFQIISTNTYGQQHGVNRDNMGAFGIAVTSKGAQIGSAIGIHANGYGEGDVILNSIGATTNGGAVDGDQEGLAYLRGYMKAETRRWTVTTSSNATLDTGTGLYKIRTGPEGASGGDPLGLWQTILNLSSSYSAGNITSFQYNTTIGGVIWMTATGDKAAGFLAKYGASVIQPITGTVVIKAVNQSETLPTRVATTVMVADTSGFPASGICSVVDQQTYEPGVPFTVVDRTHIRINTYGDHATNSLIVYGGATGLALSMDADVLAPGSYGYGNATPMRPRTLRVIGTTPTGDLLLWNTGKIGQTGFNTRALVYTKFPALSVTPKISGGTITSAVITENGNEYSAVVRAQLASGKPLYSGSNDHAPTPQVSVSGGCNAVLKVDYYTDARTGATMLGTPSTTAGAGGTKNVQIVNGGTNCTGTTISIQNTYANPYHLYDFAVVPTWNFVADGAGGKMMSVSSIYAALQTPANWPTGSNLSSEVWPHMRVDYSSGFLVQNYGEAGSDLTWMPYYFDGLQRGDSMAAFIMSDAVRTQSNDVSTPRAAEFHQRGLPVVYGKQGWRAPAAAGMRVLGNYLDAFRISAPNGGAITRVSSAGYVSPANMQTYKLFDLMDTTGQYNPISFDPVSRRITFGPAVAVATLTDTAGISVLPAYGTVTAGSTYTPTAFVSHLECPGVAFTIGAPAAGEQIDIVNTSTAACTVNYSGGIGNTATSPSATIASGAALRLFFNGSVFRVE
ncbi:hypothetical protein [Terriglobus sp. RCC_193]|uniref:hypothetical protein n=1 Tax=Terriglobus sp. RCC_193 TaxID=3239218 RepID=UPI00352667BE